MYQGKKVIVYGLGREFQKYETFLKSYFDIVAYSDKNRKSMGGSYIQPSEINTKEYDYIFITSRKFYDEIKQELHEKYNIKENRIISTKDVLGIPINIEEIRDTWVITKLSEIESGKTILDAGAGEMKYAKYCEHLKYIAQDFGKYDPQEEHRGFQMTKWDTSACNIICDIIDMPLEKETVDVIMCTEVFEHIKNPVLALKEFNRVLKTDGILLLTAPVCSLTHMAPYYYYNGFSLYWYRDHLRENGFEIIEIKEYGNYFKFLCQEMLRIQAIAEKYCGYQLQEEDYECIYKNMSLLSKLANMDQGSNEILCFGYMTLAKKVEGIEW